MTTEVIIKNKSGLVMAADSAVTISNIFTTGKVYNSANKLFSLSKYDPIGILVYNSVNINQIPVEIIIKEYRETLKSKQYPIIVKKPVSEPLKILLKMRKYFLLFLNPK